MKTNQLRIIHELLINNEKRQMIKQIEEYGLYDFWSDYKCYLFELYDNSQAVNEFFGDATISYFRIKNR